MFNYIYKLIHKNATNDDMIYIGSCDDISQRVSKHKYCCNTPNNRKYNYKVYKHIRENGGWEDWRYEIIDEVEIALRDDIYKYENACIKKYDAINKLNSRFARRTKKEYIEDNKEQVLKKYKDKYERNKEQILAKCKDKYERNKEQISQMSKDKYERNKEQILKRVKEYRERNKDEINAKRREKRRLEKIKLFYDKVRTH
jgi:hypothetical protein